MAAQGHDSGSDKSTLSPVIESESNYRAENKEKNKQVSQVEEGRSGDMFSFKLSGANIHMEPGSKLNLTGSSGANPFSSSFEQNSYCCNYCGKKFNRSQSLGGHMNAHKHERSLGKRKLETNISIAGGRYQYPYNFRPYADLPPLPVQESLNRSMRVQMHSNILKPLHPQTSIGSSYGLDGRLKSSLHQKPVIGHFKPNYDLSNMEPSLTTATRISNNNVVAGTLGLTQPTASNCGMTNPVLGGSSSLLTLPIQGSFNQSMGVQMHSETHMPIQPRTSIDSSYGVDGWLKSSFHQMPAIGHFRPSYDISDMGPSLMPTMRTSNNNVLAGTLGLTQPRTSIDSSYGVDGWLKSSFHQMPVIGRFRPSYDISDMGPSLMPAMRASNNNVLAGTLGITQSAAGNCGMPNPVLRGSSACATGQILLVASNAENNVEEMGGSAQAKNKECGKEKEVTTEEENGLDLTLKL